MPAFQNRVHIGPVEALLFQYRFFVGQTNRVVVKAHIQPGGDILPLPLHRGPVPDIQKGQDLNRTVPQHVEPLQVGFGGVYSVRPPLLPPDGLPLDLWHSGHMARPVLALKLLYGPAHHQKNDLRRKSGKIVDGIKAFQVVGRKHLAQPPLDLLDQDGEGGGLVFQLPVDIGGGIFRRGGSRLRGRRGGGRLGQPQGVQKRQGSVGPPRLPLEGPGGGGGLILSAGL